MKLSMMLRRNNTTKVFNLAHEGAEVAIRVWADAYCQRMIEKYPDKKMRFEFETITDLDRPNRVRYNIRTVRHD